jgi:DNA invertase Pin-like site-specific DNA recombinase
MENKVFGYVRVSSKQQNLDRQIESIKEYCKNNNLELSERDLFLEKVSGKNFERDEYKILKRSLRSGDTLVIKELDRLGRNKEAIKEEIKWFKDNGIILRILDIPTTLIDYSCYDNTMAKAIMEMVNNILIEVLGTIAQEERNKIRQRQMEGIQALKNRNDGKGIGRPKIEFPLNFKEVYDKWKSKSITGVRAMELLKLKKTTFYKLINEYERSYKYNHI